MFPIIKIDERYADVVPMVRIGVVRARVENTPTCDGLWAELESEAERIKQTYELLAINQRPAVAATRKVYKAFGKDPGRYRVASEALCRRVIRGLGLYRLTALVDLINVLSMRSGYAISGLDADKLEGDTLTLGVGAAGEVYEGIGRGPLNIEGMPVWRDAKGGVATPTSDEERTKITEETKHVHISINGFGEEMPMEEAVALTVELLEKYANAKEIETRIIELHP